MKGPRDSPEPDRIQKEYEKRDAVGCAHELYRCINPAFMFHMQKREWTLLSALQRESFDIRGDSRPRSRLRHYIPVLRTHFSAVVKKTAVESPQTK